MADPTNKIYFDNGMALPFPDPSAIKSENQIWHEINEYRKNNPEAKPLRVDINGFPDIVGDLKVKPFQELGIGGPLIDENGSPDIMNMAGNMLSNQLTGRRGNALELSMQPEFNSRDVRTVTDVAGTELGAAGGAIAGAKVGGTLGAKVGSAAGPWGTLLGGVLGAGGGGALGNMGMDKLQEKVGVTPRYQNPYGVAALKGAEELGGRWIFNGARRAMRFARSLGDSPGPQAVRERAQKYIDLKIKPMAWQVLDEGGLSGAFMTWLQRNPFTSKKFLAATTKQFEEASEALRKDLQVKFEGELKLPTATTSGEVATSGFNAFDSELMSTWQALDDIAAENVDPSAIVNVGPAIEMLEKAASNDVLMETVTSADTRKILSGFLQKVEQVGSENLPLDYIRSYRTQLGHKMIDPAPGEGKAAKEMRQLYNVLTEQIDQSYKQYGNTQARAYHNAANAHWSHNMSRRESLMAEIEHTLGKDPAATWAAIENAADTNRATTIREVKRQVNSETDLGREAWEHMRNMIVRKHIMPSTNLPDAPLFAQRYVDWRRNLDSDTTNEILGEVGDKFRDHWDTVYDISREIDSVLKRQSESPLWRFTATELGGPAAGAIGGAGYAQSQGDNPGAGAMYGVIVGTGLSFLSARQSWKLLSSEKFVNHLQKTINEPLVSMEANMLRLVDIYPSLDAEGREALVEMLGGMAASMSPRGQGGSPPTSPLQRTQASALQGGTAMIPPVRARQ